MKIGVVGLGYIGLVTAAVLAEAGNRVVGVDIDKERVKTLSEGKSPIYEPELQEVMSANDEALSFSGNYASLKVCAAIFVCVPTPTIEGRIDLSFVIAASRGISFNNPGATTIIKSTVIPGTARMIHEEMRLNVVSNPEFTSEGSAIQDTRHPDRIVIGGYDTNIVEDIWRFTGAPMIVTTNENAELIKYASNAFLATKISFINEIANLCEKVPGTDVEVIAKGIGYDKRIAPYFLKAGLGFGGSCFPKDTEAFVSFAKTVGIELGITNSAIRINKDRVSHVLEIIKDALGELKGRSVAVLGLSFKNNTGDTRESKAWLLVEALMHHGCSVKTFDPIVKVSIPGALACDSIEKCIEDVDAIVVSTEWNEFKILENMKPKVPVVDAKRVLNQSQITRYHGVGLNEVKN